MTDVKQPPLGGAPEPCLPPALRKPRLRRTEASEYLELVHGITLAATTLAKLATIGGGPGYQRLNRTPLYPRTELDRWATAKLGAVVGNTSQANAPA